MPFIGTQPEVGGYSVLDALTASATASYTLQKDSANFSPSSANQLLVSLNGVIQKPGTSFTVSGSTLTFSSALSSSDSIDFILAMGEPLLIGTPSDGTVTSAKLDTNIAVGGTFGVTGATTATGGVTIPASTTVGLNFGSGTDLAQLAMQSAVSNRVALRTTHTSTGDNNPFIIYQPSSAGVQNDALVVQTAGQISMGKQPSFRAGLTANQTVGNAATVTYQTTDHNIGNHFDTTTNVGRFTCPVAGRYLFGIAMGDGNNQGVSGIFALCKNGSRHYDFMEGGLPSGVSGHYEKHGSVVVNAAANDYFDIRQISGGNKNLEGTADGLSTRNRFWGHMLG